MTNENRFALYSGYIHSERFATKEEAEKHAAVILQDNPNKVVQVIEIHSAFTATVTVSPATEDEDKAKS